MKWYILTFSWEHRKVDYSYNSVDVWCLHCILGCSSSTTLWITWASSSQGSLLSYLALIFLLSSSWNFNPLLFHKYLSFLMLVLSSYYFALLLSLPRTIGLSLCSSIFLASLTCILKLSLCSLVFLTSLPYMLKLSLRLLILFVSLPTHIQRWPKVILI